MMQYWPTIFRNFYVNRQIYQEVGYYSREQAETDAELQQDIGTLQALLNDKRNVSKLIEINLLVLRSYTLVYTEDAF